MNNRKQRKFNFLSLSFLLMCLILFFIADVFTPVTANADMGPKPSVHIQFQNLGDEVCYATLLSKTQSTGPASAWNGNEETAEHKGNYDYARLEYEIWKAFVEYEDADGFYFLQTAWEIQDTKEIAWTYYPPNVFKILLYYPERNVFAVSDICKKYAFDTYYTVDMEGLDMDSVEYNKDLSNDVRLNAYRYYNWPPELFSFLIRILLTVLIEVAIGLCFGIRGKWQLLLLLGTNITTQFILNLMLNIVGFITGGSVVWIAYIILELLVFAIEGLIYSLFMNKLSKKTKQVWVYWLYAFLGNLCSYGAGLLLAEILPWLF